jgi:hypothetical protein
MNIDTDSYDTIPGCEWVVDFEASPPQRLVKIEFDTGTLMALVDVADAATFAPSARTRENAAALRDYFLPIISQLERRSLMSHEEFKATEHLAASE